MEDNAKSDGVWILAEAHAGHVRAVAHELLARGRALADARRVPLVAVVLGAEVSAADLRELIERGADVVRHAAHPGLTEFLPQPYARVFEDLLQRYRPEIVLAAATTLGRTLLPYVAARVHAGLTADCTQLEIAPDTGRLLQTRPAIGGNILATIETPSARPQMATVRPHSGAAAPRQPGRAGRIVPEPVDPVQLGGGVRFVRHVASADDANLTDARIVVAGGRGFRTAERFQQVHAVARALGGAVGASRDAVDRGWIAYPHQVGLSGKTVSPDLYVAIGISGAVQHLAGMQTARTIVAINSDPDALIFQLADYGIVGDLNLILPLLLERLAARHKGSGFGVQGSRAGGSGEPLDRPSQRGTKNEERRTEAVSPNPEPRTLNPEHRSPYGLVTPAIADALAGIVGPRHVIYRDPERLAAFAHDEVAEAAYAHAPEVVVRPGSAEEIAAVMRLANAHRIPVTPRGAGSGLSGGAVPLHGGIVLAFDRMNHIVEIDAPNLMAVVEPGVVTNELNTQLAPYGLVFAGYPMSLETCCIGGNVAENAGGGKAVKYGVTGRYITGIECVTPTGEIVRLGGKCVKDVTGYNLVQLLVGSEGTLAVFTRITVRLMPLPRAIVSLLALFPTVQAAIDTVPRIMTRGGIIPTAIEFMDQLSVAASCRYLNEHIPWQDCGAMLLIEVDGSERRQVETEAETVGELCLQNGAQEVYLADNHTTRERIWRVRRNIAEAFKSVSPDQSLEDVVVPIARIPDMMPALAALGSTYGVQIPCYGHAGDGNLHATPVRPPDMTRERWHALLPDLLADLYRATAALGGTISGEHGIGHKRKAYLPLVLSEPEIELMRGIKRAFDPNNILNPGKIFDV